MSMNKQLLKTIGAFVLLIPFRLPISVLLIKVFNALANVGASLPNHILMSNVAVTKGVYDAIFALIFISGIYRLMPDSWGDEPKLLALIFLCIVPMIVYIVYDIHSTIQIFQYLFKP